MGYDFDEPPVLFCDNTGAIALSKHRTAWLQILEARCPPRSQMSRVRCKFVAAELISVAYVPTSENGADIFTKHLNKHTFTRLASTVLGQPCDTVAKVVPRYDTHESSFPPAKSNAETERQFKDIARMQRAPCSPLVQVEPNVR